MRTIVLVGALLVAGGIALELSSQQAPPPAPAANAAKIAYVNSERLTQESPGATEAQTTIRREMDKYRAEFALADDSVKNMITAYQQQQVMLSPDAKKRQEDAIRAKSTALEQRRTQAEQTLNQRSETLLKPIMDRINKALEDVRKENGYALVFNVSAGAIVAADTTLDLTTKVLQKLRAPTSAAPRNPGR
ncbi:MAG: OmpH family outer membrane protein [Longimicrobiales bacterium]